MKGLSSTALQNTTSLPAAMQSRSAVSSAHCLTMPAILSAASMLMPARVEPTLTRRAHALGGGQRVGDGVHQLVVGRRCALVHERGEAAHEVDAHLGAGLVHGHGDARQVGVGHGGADLGDGRDGDALVHDRDAELALELLGGGYQLLGGLRHLVVDLARHGVDVRIRAGAQVQAQRDGADVQVLLADHGKRFGDFFRGDLHDAVLLTGDSFATG